MPNCPECDADGRVFLGMDEATVYECPECGNKWERPEPARTPEGGFPRINQLNTEHDRH